jgi:hypothetical protein
LLINRLSDHVSAAGEDLINLWRRTAAYLRDQVAPVGLVHSVGVEHRSPVVHDGRQRLIVNEDYIARVLG